MLQRMNVNQYRRASMTEVCVSATAHVLR